MSVCAVMMVRDEADVIESTLAWLTEGRGHVDEIIVSDNLSTDGTREIVSSDARVALVLTDDDVAYRQSKKMTALAQIAMKRGHSWVVPVDADEAWYAANEMSLRDYLSAQGPDVQIVKADLYNHIPTGKDPAGEPDPFRRIGWRFDTPGALPKVAARVTKRLTIHAGNHGADYGGRPSFAVGGLGIRHYSWRTPEQYLRKIRNGCEAYAATNLPASVGAHWRAFADVDDDAILEHFREWFFVENPSGRRDLLYDPLVA